MAIYFDVVISKNLGNQFANYFRPQIQTKYMSDIPSPTNNRPQTNPNSVIWIGLVKLEMPIHIDIRATIVQNMSLMCSKPRFGFILSDDFELFSTMGGLVSLFSFFIHKCFAQISE